MIALSVGANIWVRGRIQTGGGSVFADAYNKASSFTHPVVSSVRLFDGTIECSLGAFVVLNAEGWIVTVAHILSGVIACQENSKEIKGYKEQVLAIEQDPRLDFKQKRKRVNHLKSNPKWVTNASLWWGSDGRRIDKFKVLAEADLAIGQLTPFDPKSISTYPTLKDPSNLPLGTSLCKLGFPFHSIKATFDEANNRFTFEPGALPVPRFPIEGIFTRHVAAGKTKDGKYEVKFLETSSPGLRGQSGGPIFDIRGTVWGIQSKTVHFPLGFSPKVKKDGHEVEENQFLNAGWGVHPELLIAFLRDSGIQFNLSDY